MSIRSVLGGVFMMLGSVLALGATGTEDLTITAIFAVIGLAMILIGNIIRIFGGEESFFQLPKR